MDFYIVLLDVFISVINLKYLKPLSFFSFIFKLCLYCFAELNLKPNI